MLFTIFIQLFVMSQYATKGDEISKLEQRKQELNNENIKLNREIAEARNIDYITTKSENLGYVPLDAKEVKYITLQEK